MTFKIVNTIHVPGIDFGESLLAGFDAGILNIMGRTEEELRRSSSDADAVICSGPLQPWNASVIGSMKRCRIIASLGVGYDRIDLEAASSLGIAVTNIPAYCIDEVSSHAVSLMLALSRKLFTMDRAVRESHVNFVPPNRKSITGHAMPVIRLRDQTAGIFGFGKIGSQAAFKAKALGMRVIVHDPYVLDEVIRGWGMEPVDFGGLLEQSDIISIHSSLTGETRGRFDEKAFSLMKPGAYIVNTARGEIIQEPALIGALLSGRIAGAGLDVTEKDPVPAGDPILGAPNTILTGHSAWYSTAADSNGEFWYRAMEQVVSALKGTWPVFAVNPQARKTWLERWG